MLMSDMYRRGYLGTLSFNNESVSHPDSHWFSIYVGTEPGNDPYLLNDEYGFGVGEFRGFKRTEVQDEKVLEAVRALVKSKHIKLSLVFKDGCTTVF